jgi:hypothetical protein
MTGRAQMVQFCGGWALTDAEDAYFTAACEAFRAEAERIARDRVGLRVCWSGARPPLGSGLRGSEFR